LFTICNPLATNLIPHCHDKIFKILFTLLTHT
jgi:hypothetical protein